ncbi:helix-turn-helix transcriptional regulator [Chitinophaga sedimenti]|uniref:helix-turn-helix transcriptional regulator n=1 Tax=Chitinophaga sedimenti TaxID=2033606 RepID=UPI0020055178|nr:helix-turn-helix transcriptional regulator [Chitinophaga sedimenti]MCK7556228.1 helix-turn-helix transcriptional regulator [Chitinophaga sedimenti]
MFFTPSPKTAEITTVEHIPCPHPYHRMIKMADVSIISGGFGRILQQSEKGAQYLLTKHCFELDQPIELHVPATQPGIVLTYTLEGHLDMEHSLLGLLQHQCDTGFLYYLPAGDHYLQVPPGACTVLKLHINLDLLQLVCHGHPEMDGILEYAQGADITDWTIRNVKSNKKTKNLINKITQSTKRGGSRILHLDQRIQELLIEYVEACKKKAPKPRRGYKVYEDHKMKLRHTADSMGELAFLMLPLKELQCRTGIPFRNLIVALRDLYKKGRKEYRTEVQLRKARELLLTTDKSIQQIAHEVHYEESSSLSRAFRNQFGCTPEQYRQQKSL